MATATHTGVDANGNEIAGSPDMTGSPVGYPLDLVREVVAADGLRYSVRPIRPDDAERLVAFHSHLSPHTCYFRFFSYHPVLSEDEVQRFTHVDYDDRVALVVVVDDRIIGVGRYDRRPGTDEAEVAFVVADDFQHHGIGSLLLDQLVEIARAHGIVTIAAETLGENRGMLTVFAQSGYPVTQEIEWGTVYLRFPIAPTASSTAALTRRDSTRRVTRPEDSASS